MSKSVYRNRKILSQDEDVALIGTCVIHPKSDLKVLQWRDAIYYLDSSEIDKWELNKKFYFYPDKAHAFSLKEFK